MVDTRFHFSAGPSVLSGLVAESSLATSIADERADILIVTGANELGLAGPDEITLAAAPAYAGDLRKTKAGAVVVIPALADQVPPGTIAIVSDAAHAVFADMLDNLYPGNTRSVVAASSTGAQSQQIVEADVQIGRNVVLGPGVAIGRGTVIGPNTVIGAGVAIGRNCVIGANCTVECAYLGNNVVVHSGARIGCEGFGWLDFGRTNRKVPQLGRVIVQDSVEIGANSTIDRGALGDTVIGEGTKIDNLVQIGHNCQIGRFCLIAAMSGLAGSTIVGDGVLMGGGTGTSGHISIGSGSVVHGRAAVTKDWPAGSKLAGAPAQDIREFWREIATVRRLSKGDKR